MRYVLAFVAGTVTGAVLWAHWGDDESQIDPEELGWGRNYE